MKIIKMKKIFTLICVIIFCNDFYGQQLPHITQYMNNNYVINPAVSGMYDYYNVNTTIRDQWAGMNDGPRTSVISIYGKHNENIGLGGTVYNDITGPTSRLGAAVSYSYSFKLTSSINLALALQGGFTQFKIIKNLQTEHQNDPLLEGGDIVRTLPDATFGINFSGSKWYLGAAIPQLLSSELNLMDKNVAKIYDSYSQNGKLASHVYVLGSYIFDLGSDFEIEPSVFLKSVEGAKTQIDFGVNSEYKNLFSLGANYKINNDLSPISILCGVKLNNKFNIGYSFGIPSSSTSTYFTGSHEFMLGMTLGK